MVSGKPWGAAREKGRTSTPAARRPSAGTTTSTGGPISLPDGGVAAALKLPALLREQTPEAHGSDPESERRGRRSTRRRTTTGRTSLQSMRGGIAVRRGTSFSPSRPSRSMQQDRIGTCLRRIDPIRTSQGTASGGGSTAPIRAW